MSRKYNKKWTVDEFEKGNIIALKIPRAIRTSTDNLRLFCVVVDRPHRNSYELRCRHGLLTRFYATRNLERVPDDVAATIEIRSVAKKITLARAAELESTSTHIRISSQCKGQCGKRCRCIKEKVERSLIHCHREDHDCGNLAPPATDLCTKQKSTQTQSSQTLVRQIYEAEPKDDKLIQLGIPLRVTRFLWEHQVFEWPVYRLTLLYAY